MQKSVQYLEYDLVNKNDLTMLSPECKKHNNYT